MTTRSTSVWRLFATVAMAWVVILILASAAFAQADIHSAGPLTDITIGDDLTCQVTAGGNDQFSPSSPPSCGTAVVVGGQAFGFQGNNAFDSVSPATLAGAGTTQNPYTVTTTVKAVNANGAPLVAVTEADSYVVGNDYYRTDLTVTNTSGGTLPNVRLYHAGNCSLNGNDNGFGFADAATGAVACTQTPGDAPAGPFMEFLPITPNDDWAEAVYSYVYAAITDQSDLPDVVDTNGNPNDPGTPEDNGEGIDWDTGTLDAGALQTFSMCSIFASGAPATACIGSTSTPTTGEPSVLTTSAPSVTATGAGVTGSVNPGGLPTTASFQYGLDPKYSGGGPVVYTNSTPAQSVGADFSAHTVSTSLSGLVPNALYHVRLVATNSAGTTFGPDVPFTTAKAPAPGAPTLGKTFNISLVSGVVLVKIHGVFIPLTELTQIPKNTVINALHGALSLTTAVPGGAHPAHDAASKGTKPKPKPKPKTQKGTFSGAVFKLSQATAGASKGLVNLTLVEGAAFKGSPTYGTCKKAKKAGDASAAAVSKKILQLLHASAKGKFKTTGRYSAATVRGTKWTIADRCDGTLTHDVTDSVAVTDFVRHKTIILHAGQSYLAKARK
jgi:hypothetical protein